MRRVAFLIMVFAFSALALPAAVAHAHTPTHAWVNADDCEVIVRLGSHLEEDHMHSNSPGAQHWVLYRMVFVSPDRTRNTCVIFAGRQQVHA